MTNKNKKKITSNKLLKNSGNKIYRNREALIQNSPHSQTWTYKIYVILFWPIFSRIINYHK